jgi:hypothetical protein
MKIKQETVQLPISQLNLNGMLALQISTKMLFFGLTKKTLRAIFNIN